MAQCKRWVWGALGRKVPEDGGPGLVCGLHHSRESDYGPRETMTAPWGASLLAFSFLSGTFLWSAFLVSCCGSSTIYHRAAGEHNSFILFTETQSVAAALKWHNLSFLRGKYHWNHLLIQITWLAVRGLSFSFPRKPKSAQWAPRLYTKPLLARQIPFPGQLLRGTWRHCRWQRICKLCVQLHLISLC